jgi:signal transduction histidine kinase
LYAVFTVLILWRIARAGLAAALLAGIVGWGLERARFGASDRDALRRIESELRQRLDASADALDAMAARVAQRRDAIAGAARDTAAARELFDAADGALANQETGRTGLTIYDAGSAPLAWAGRVSEFRKEQLAEPALFVASSALGPRLVHVEPVVSSTDRQRNLRIGTVVVEQLLGPAPTTPVPGPDQVVVATSVAPVSLRPRGTTAAPANPYAFLIPSPRGGGALIEAQVSPADLEEARARWRNGAWAAVWSVVAVTLLLCTGPLLEIRRRSRDLRRFGVITATIVLALIAARLMLWFGVAPIVGTDTFTSPFDLLLDALLVAALTWIAHDLLDRRRITRPRPRLLDATPPSLALIGATYAAAGAIDAWLVSAYEQFLRRIVSNATLDVLHFSLHPIGASRLAIGFGLVLIHASVIWTMVAVLRVPGVWWRTRRRRDVVAVIGGGFVAGVVLALALIERTGSRIPVPPSVVALAVAGGCAVVVAQMRARARRASQAVRLLAVFLGLLVPALAMYPAVLAFATEAKERLVEREFGPEATRQREELKQRLFATLDEIDSLPALADYVTRSSEVAGSANDRAYLAFLVWSKTDLAAYRLKSAVELYAAPSGDLVSRFALNLPEYATGGDQTTRCDWDLVDEVSPFGSSQRHVLRASRGICNDDVPVGSIVVRVMLDPGSLPFISSQDPYLESLRPPAVRQGESAPGRDVELVVYGWSRAPIYSTGTSVWQLPDDVFQRLVASREPFWTTLTRDGARFRVHFMSDRGAIYALGYPQLTLFGHVVNLAELIVLTGVLFVALTIGATLFSALTAQRPVGGRALVREVRSSFYRKLFIFFVAAAVVPVVILALATRAYFATQLIASLDEAAAKTATVAQRLVEDYATLQQRGSAGFGAIDDQIMVLVRRAIDQGANLFDGKYVLATSERDLFASGLIPIRTPSDVYRTIVLDRLPTFVGEEEVGDVPYRLAASPVRAAGRELIVTVPQSLRQQDTEQQIDELDRRVVFAVVLFSLLGAAVGYWMAERIADPVNRLTRATRRIARGDLDARIATTSSDELRRLVEDFNQMADDLKRQRADLERTQRLEAWADMARQVAHDIKNPLTPIQLSAEHARRVNQDRGRPLSPVLDDCVNAILTQVKLLRQIAAEFSSFASSPTARPEPTRISEVIDEVVQPYRAGLANRIRIDVEAPADLPLVTIDRMLFGRALTNVIENALHAMPGNGTLTVRSEAVIVDGRQTVVVRIIDTGVGMDADALAHVFEPYFSTKTTGTGLGLTIAKRNVELNGGTIEVRSERGVGTTVTISVPA